MVARRIISNHNELINRGTLTHEEIDNSITGSSFLVVDENSPNLDKSKKLVLGNGLSFTDTGSELIINVDYVWNEEPSGFINGSNNFFFLNLNRNQSKVYKYF